MKPTLRVGDRVFAGFAEYVVVSVFVAPVSYILWRNGTHYEMFPYRGIYRI